VPDSPWQAIAQPPAAFLRSSWPWRSLGYLAGGVGAGLGCLLALVLLGVLGVLLAPALVGLGLLAGLVLSGVGYGAVERRRLRLVCAQPVPAAHDAPAATGPGAWLSTRLRERATWWELGYLALSGTLLWPLELAVLVAAVLFPASTLAAPLLTGLFPAAFPAGSQLLAAGWLWLSPVLGIVVGVGSMYVLALAAGARARLARWLLAAPPDGAALAEVTRSRARIVDRFEAERRRIERDLHDGVQGRLLGLTVQLGLAGAALAATDPAAELVGRAHDEAVAVLEVLRGVVEGIHPRILTDRGLPAAVDELAASAAVAVQADLALPERLDAAVEACLYYTISEAVTNAAKHSGAELVRVRCGPRGARVRLEVTDDGTGGAVVTPGGGLQGLADRAAAVGGTFRLASQVGGPTRLVLDVPHRTA
jgi:signal transduction histidine kinase